MSDRSDFSSDDEGEGSRLYNILSSSLFRMINNILGPKIRRGREYSVPSYLSIPQNSLESTDVGFNIMYDIGCVKSKKMKGRTITKCLTEREQGIMPFSNSQKRWIGSRYLPNRLVEKIKFSKKPFCGIFSREGDYFISGSQDAKIRLYRPGSNNMKLLKSFHILHMGWSILDMALNSDSSQLVYTSWSDNLYLCHLKHNDSPQVSLNLEPLALGDNFCLFSIVFSHDDQEILGGSHGGHIYVYNLDVMKRTLMANAHGDDVNAVTFADDTSFIFISGGDDGLCKVWDRRTLDEHNPEPVGIFAGHHDGITFIDAKKDGRCFASNSKDQTIKLWDIRCFSPSDAIRDTQREVNRRNWDYRWQSIPSENVPKIDGDTSLMTYWGHEVKCTLIRARFSPMFTTGQRFIYCGSATGAVHVYDVLTGTMVARFDEHTSVTRDVHWHPYQPILASSSWDGSVGYWTYSDTNAEKEVSKI